MLLSRKVRFCVGGTLTYLQECSGGQPTSHTTPIVAVTRSLASGFSLKIADPRATGYLIVDQYPEDEGGAATQIQFRCQRVGWREDFSSEMPPILIPDPTVAVGEFMTYFTVAQLIAQEPEFLENARRQLLSLKPTPVGVQRIRSTEEVCTLRAVK